MIAHLPALVVLVPLLAAPICFIFSRSPAIGWVITVVSSWVSFAIACVMAVTLLNGGEIQYVFGGWAPPWGIEYVVDQLNLLVVLVVTGVAAVIFPATLKSVRPEVASHQLPLFFVSLLLCFSGLLGIAVTGDAFNLFVFLEISSLSTYTLISMGKDRRALTAAFNYLIMGTIGATFILIAVGILYMLTGTLNMADLAVRLPSLGDSRALQVAFAFTIVGVGLKLAMFPLHLWLPNAYAYAPSAVSAFIAATATKVAVYVMIRFLYSIFGAEFSFSEIFVQWLLLPVSVCAILFTSVVALFQHDVKRLLAYSSVAQIGYMLLGIALVNQTGLAAALIHLFNHALMKGALFLAVAAMVFRVGSSHVDQLRGIGRKMPWTSAAFVAGGLSIIGVPATVGFVSKWYLVLAAIENGWWWMAAIVLVASLIAVVYIWRIVELAYFADSEASETEVKEAPLIILIPIWMLVASNFYFGIHSSVVTRFAEGAAAMLWGQG
ncbi:MAG: monovalent cation/H+ antiporter subunit D family protein [Pseudomonadota bacterium]